MKINATTKMATPIEEKVDQNLKTRTGMVMISDGKSKPELARLHLSMEMITIQRQDTSTPAPTPTSTTASHPPIESKPTTQSSRNKSDRLSLCPRVQPNTDMQRPLVMSPNIEHRVRYILFNLLAFSAFFQVNGEYITACPHDDAVNILRNAGDIVVLTVKHYRAATPFLQKQLSRETPESDNDATCAELKVNVGGVGQSGKKYSANNSRPVSISSEPENRWIDLVSVPLMMAYVTRYIYGTDKLRPNAFEVRGLNGTTTGIIHCDDLAILSQWLKYITDNIVGLTSLQMKLYNRNFPVGERIEYMGWVNEGVISNHISWQSYKPRFLVLKGTEVMLFDAPPLNVAGLQKATVAYKVYQTMFRVVKESETVDSRQHCFLLQSSGHEPRYLSVETRQELLRIENSWNAAIVTSVIKLGRKTFAVSHHGKTGGLTLDWQQGFSLTEGADASVIWQYKFSQLRGSSDDGKSKLKLHFQDHETRSIETKELECQVLQSLLFCMHAFLTAKVASVDPAFLSSIQQA
ncbi:syntrophin [Culex quinquefasciatus]|uniref:Syntrophin n=2 Tax=Culex pipiens complex TaxID=518105 RepID=B0X6I9_CULQU|nr:syntrophin [Culex quinquefasciatus]|eukprot:XP_001865261.1 syntrophin [Culex quinquefasciatus]